MPESNESEDFFDTTAPTLILDDEEEAAVEFVETHPDLVELVEFFDEEDLEDLKEIEEDLLE